MQQIPLSYHYIFPNKKQTECVLLENQLTLTSQSKNGASQTFNFTYQDLKKVHLRKPDLDRYGINLYFKNGQRFHFKNLVFFKKENGQLNRNKNTPEDKRYSGKMSNNYRAFIDVLHERIVKHGFDEDVKLFYGNSFLKFFILGVIVLITAFIFPMAYRFASVSTMLLLISASITLLLFYFKISFKKRYKANEIPEKYLPAVFEDTNEIEKTVT